MPSNKTFNAETPKAPDVIDMKYGSGAEGKRKPKGKKRSDHAESGDATDLENRNNTSPCSKTGSTSRKSAGSSGTKFVPLFSDEGQDRATLRLPGRHECLCQARRHPLVANCMGCGRIVCGQEGSGPCFFCGELVCTTKEEAVLRKGGQPAADLKRRLMGDLLDDGGEPSEFSFTLAEIGEDMQRAIDAKDRLLEFDQTSQKRTTVIDDQSDYFTIDNPWFTEEEKAKLRKKYEALRKKRFAPRSQQAYTLDFAGRKVIECVDEVDMYVNPEDQQHAKTSEEMIDQQSAASFSQNAPVDFELRYVDNEASPAHQHGMSSLGGSLRIQDQSFLEMADDGWALSMHQPYASLLTSGIMRHEGRTWYSAHRGRLWIAAAAKDPLPEDIQQLEKFYSTMHSGSEPLRFPAHYPTGCLLGCVDVLDCLPQEQYMEQYPNGESMSPYVFICENPQELMLKFPIQGKHKLYKLEPKIHQAARKSVSQAMEQRRKKGLL